MLQERFEVSERKACRVVGQWDLTLVSSRVYGNCDEAFTIMSADRKNFADIRIQHKGQVVDQVIEGAFTVLEGSRKTELGRRASQDFRNCSFGVLTWPDNRRAGLD